MCTSYFNENDNIVPVEKERSTGETCECKRGRQFP